MIKVLENVRQFQSFGDLLQADFNERVKLSETPSIRKYGTQLEVDASTLLQTMKKRRRLSGRLIQTIGRKLGLSNEELAYVIESETELNSPVELCTDEAALAINDWRYDAILELFNGKSVATDFNYLANALQIPPKRLNELKETLIESNLLEVRDGLWVDQVAHVTTIASPADTSEAARDYQKSLCETSMKAIETVSPELRNHTSVMLKIDEDDIPAIMGVLKTTRRNLARDYQSPENPHKNLYALQIALFPLLACFCALVLVFASPSAFATKDRGGGNVTADGKLAEVGVASDSNPIRLDDLRVLLIPTVAKIGGELPGLFEDLMFIGDDSVHWFLNSKLDDHGCEFKASVKISAKTVACQSFDSEGITEIRILKSYWDSATSEQKTDLVLHERLRTLLFKRGVRDCEDCLFRSVLAFREPVSATFILGLQSALRLNHVGVYFLLEQRQRVLDFVSRVMTNACALGSENSYRSTLLTASSSKQLPAGVSPSELEAANYILWLNSADFQNSCRDVELASLNTLSYWRGQN